MNELTIELAVLTTLKKQGLIDEREYIQAEEELRKLYLKETA